MAKTYPNEGSLWPKEDRTNPKSPHYTGSANFAGQDYWFAGWKNDDGTIGCKLNPKEEDSQLPYLTLTLDRQGNDFTGTINEFSETVGRAEGALKKVKVQGEEKTILSLKFKLGTNPAPAPAEETEEVPF